MNKYQILSLALIAGILVIRTTGILEQKPTATNTTIATKDYGIDVAGPFKTNPDTKDRTQDALRIGWFYLSGADQIERDGRLEKPVVATTQSLATWINNATELALRKGQVSQSYPSLTQKLDVLIADAINLPTDKKDVATTPWQSVGKPLTQESRAKVVDVLRYFGNSCISFANK